MTRFCYGESFATCERSASIYDICTFARGFAPANQEAHSRADAPPGTGTFLRRLVYGGFAAFEAAGSYRDADLLAAGHLYGGFSFHGHWVGRCRYRNPLHPAWAVDTPVPDAVRRAGIDDIRHSHHP